MSPQPLDLEAHLDHMARVLDLPVRPEWRANVLTFLAGVAAAGQVVTAFELPPETESAPVFEA